MAYLLIALVALGAVLGYSSIESTSVERAQYTAELAPGTLDGNQFARFSYAVERYITANPTVSGNISPAVITGNYTSSFLNAVSCWVSPSGGGPRALICSADLGSGALSSALKYSQNDASFGIPSADDKSWTSAAGPSGSSPQTLENPVPAGSSIVFVVTFN